MQSALEFVNVDDDEQSSLWMLLAAILNLGNVRFDAKGDDASVVAADSKATLATVARLLSLASVDALEAALTTRAMRVAAQTLSIPLKPDAAQDAADSLAKMLYSGCFVWLVDRINDAIVGGNGTMTLGGGGEASNAIGILDIFGFENFEVNSFEQLCINWTNENLQQLFTATVFKIEQAEYERQGIEWSSIDFVDNQACLDMMQHRTGLVSMLDEETRFPNGTDESFLDKLLSTNAKSGFVSAPKRERGAFTVKHYAGDVTYRVAGFLEKNRDTVPPELLAAIDASDDDFVRGVVAAATATTAPAASAAATSKRAATTLASNFRRQLTDLINVLSRTQTRYVRCIKPNDEKVSAATIMTEGVVSRKRPTRDSPIRTPACVLVVAFDLQRGTSDGSASLLWHARDHSHSQGGLPGSPVGRRLLRALSLRDEAADAVDAADVGRRRFSSAA